MPARAEALTKNRVDPQCERRLAARSKAVATKTEGLSAIILIGNVGSKKCPVLEPCLD